MTAALPYQNYIENRRRQDLLRALRPTENLAQGHARRDGVDYINFAGNDYLGLSRHPALIARMQDYAARYGAGATASRLVTGNHPLYDALERRIAQGKGTEAALILGGGYQANMTVLAALADSAVIGQPVTVAADRLSHHSLLQGAALSGARLLRFRHNDYAHLENILHRQAEQNAHVIIVTESVFGMDGDGADLAKLIELKTRYGATLYVDEAHATGLYGKNGFGFCADYPGRIDIAMGTFGKALGSYGAYIGCSAALREFLIQHCAGLVYSTALPPPVLGAIEAALDLLPQMESQRAYLQTQARRLIDALRYQGWDCGVGNSHIVPVLLGGENAALMLAEHLKQRGILAPAIRPPTVPKGSSRLRLSLSAAQSVDDIGRLIAALAELAADYMPAARAS